MRSTMRLQGGVLKKRDKSDDILRSSSFGLMVEVNGQPRFNVENIEGSYSGNLVMYSPLQEDEAEYVLTQFGRVFLECVNLSASEEKRDIK